MARRSKRGYLQSIYARYRQSSRAEKQTILDEFIQVCGYQIRYLATKSTASIWESAAAEFHAGGRLQ